MYYQNVIIGKLEHYVFVKGASIQDALTILINDSLELGRTSSTRKFTVFARHDYPRRKSYAKGFGATSEENLLSMTKDLALEKAREDYLNTRYVDGLRVGDFVKFFEPNDYWAEFGDEIRYTGNPKNTFLYHLEHAKKLRGVNLYFNKQLLEHHVQPDPNELMHREYHSLLITTHKPVKRNSLVAIEPLGDLEGKRLEDVVQRYS